MNDQPFPYKRILIYGVTGSGKTTLARQLSTILEIPWTSVDDLTFEKNWVQVEPEVQRRKFEEICAQDAWILDTAYGTWLDIPLSRADLIIALDYPRWFSFLRLLRRTIMRNIDKKPICNGNVETWKSTFSRNSILLWHFRSFKSKKRRIDAWCQEGSGYKVIRLRSSRETELLL